MKTIEQPSGRPQTGQKLRVAAYIRVSTLLVTSKENSFETQERYFTELIRSNPNWRMAGIYSDNGVSGTSKEKRPDFKG
jgi:DNA invertase Pin-like site-specific DNA recombinase